MADTAVIVSCRKTKRRIDPRTVRRRAERLLNLLGLAGSELSVVLCDDSFIRVLNRKYRDIDNATDVLAFPMHERDATDMTCGMLGDVIVSVDTAACSARRRNRLLVDEVTSLLIHGLLHLIGYEHDNSDDKRVMNMEAARLEKAVAKRKATLP